MSHRESPLDELSDKDLVRRCLERGAKDDRPCAELFRRYQMAIWRVCYRFAGHPQDAEDLLQEVFFKAFAGLALAFGLGGRQVARNALAGFYARDVFTLGDRLISDGKEGALEAIGTLNAEIAIEGGRLVIPNTRLTEMQVEIKAK